jgi:D-alanyl-D-alanine carboxypeptidase (penicillin-binding protein 5/6)
MLAHRRTRFDHWWAVVLAALIVVTILLLRSHTNFGLSSASPGSCPSDDPDCLAATATPGLDFAQLPPTVTARAAAVVEGSCGALLYDRNAHERRAPASLVKLATALVAVERGDLEAKVDVNVDSGLLLETTGSTVMGLQPGMSMTLRDLLYGLLLPSGNDAALVIAEHIAGSVPAFVELMNQRAQSLGLSDTYFTNPHGLDEPGLYSSAADLALLGRYVMANPALARIVATTIWQPAWDGPPIWNGNALLGSYPGLDGLKVGYTEHAGQTMVATAERDGRRLFVAVLGAYDRYTDVWSLLDWAFASVPSPCSVVSP